VEETNVQPANRLSTRRHLSWRVFALAALVTTNAVLVAITLAGFFLSDVNSDWDLYRAATLALPHGTLYDFSNDYAFRYTPLAAYLFALIVPLGPVVWSLLHLAALPALPRRMAVYVAASFPFWQDVYLGNVTTFCFVAAASAITGSTIGSAAFFTLLLLAPRPLMLPVAVWLLWKRPKWRIRFGAMAALAGIAIALTGYGTAWLTSLTRGGMDIGARYDLSPTFLIGPVWIPAGVALAAWLTWKGRLGWASLAASPYWLPHYLMMPLLELIPSRRDSEDIPLIRDLARGTMSARISAIAKRIVGP
jgi:hypothetical protein